MKTTTYICDGVGNRHDAHLVLHAEMACGSMHQLVNEKHSCMLPACIGGVALKIMNAIDFNQAEALRLLGTRDSGQYEFVAIYVAKL